MNQIKTKTWYPKVLVVDDSSESMRLNSFILARHKCDVTMIYDGEDALKHLTSGEYDLIIMDWLMPRMGGADALGLADRRIHKIKKHSKKLTPVVVFTGMSLEDLDWPQLKHFELEGAWSKSDGIPKLVRSFADVLGRIQGHQKYQKIKEAA